MKIKLLTFLMLTFLSVNVFAGGKYEYKWTERHPVLTKYISDYKHNIKEMTPYKMKNSLKYLNELEKILIEENVPKEIAILAAIESDFNPVAISQSNAVGMWQFKKNTALEWGLIVNKHIDERNDWRKSTRAAARYIKWLAEENFNGNYETAILSYNAGVGNIKNLMGIMKITDPWVLLEYEDILNKESREFLPKFITYMMYMYHLKEINNN